ncbi:MAG: energy-coupling factor transporter ATPase [Clostridia bacterium]|nr:energy-coupling factor transporter ATPase [Clostridia bacterium]
MPIQIQGLTHTYSPGSPFQATAIHDVNCTLNNGEFIGVVGHTGSGKSTLVQHLNGLLAPSQGKVLVDGLDTADKASRKAIRQKVGLVFQYPEHQLFEETVEKDVAFGPKNLGLSDEEISRRVRKALTLVGLNPEEIGPRSPFELSGGQMRRVAIAGILAMEPQYLVLDEPTAGLDPMGRDSILQMVQALHAQGDVTVIMVSHSMDDIARLATRLIVMDHGALVADGAPREIFKQIDMMESIGLGVPQAAKLCQLLRQQGIQMPDDLYLLSQVKEHLLALWKEAGVC